MALGGMLGGMAGKTSKSYFPGMVQNPVDKKPQRATGGLSSNSIGIPSSVMGGNIPIPPSGGMSPALPNQGVNPGMQGGGFLGLNPDTMKKIIQALIGVGALGNPGSSFGGGMGMNNPGMGNPMPRPPMGGGFGY